MSRGDKLFAVAAAVAILMALWLGISLQPEQPNFASHGGYKEQAASYRAGGAGCEPATIESLPARFREGKADACAEAEERHREATNGLVDSRRSAKAAEAGAAYTAIQARIEVWGAVLGLLTLLAASAAAFFAKKAADHTKTSANEAGRAANAAANMLEIEQTPFLSIEIIDGENVSWNSATGAINAGNPVFCRIRSAGRSTAILTRISRQWKAAEQGKAPPIADGHWKDVGIPIGPEGIVMAADSEKNVTRKRKQQLVFYGILEFADIAMKQTYQSGFAFAYVPDSRISKRGLITAPFGRDYWYTKLVKREDC